MSDKKYKHAKDAPSLELGAMVAECTQHPEASSGSLHFRFADTCVTVTLGEKEIGRVEGCLGGGFELHDASLPGLTFTVGSKAIWNAYQQALVKQGLKRKAALL